MAQISQRKGLVSEVGGAEYATIKADVPLDNMFGYSSELRSSTQVISIHQVVLGVDQVAMRWQSLAISGTSSSELNSGQWWLIRGIRWQQVVIRGPSGMNQREPGA